MGDEMFEKDCRKVTDAYAQWLRSWGASERTVVARERLARSLLRRWGVEGFTTDNLQAFFASNPEWSAWTRSTYQAHLRDFCAWLTSSERIAADPMAGVRAQRRPKTLPRPLSEAEVERVLAVATGRVRDWILLALLAGLRAHEIAKLRGEDVTPEGIYVLGKGGKPEVIPTHPDLWAMAQRYPRHGYWFPGGDHGHLTSSTVTNRVSELFHPLGIHGSIHRCRHVYGTRLLRAGVNIRVVQRLMRHSNLETTALYTAVDEDELRAAVSLLSA